MNTKAEWDFNINLSCSEPIAAYNSTSHKLKAKIISAKEFEFDLDDVKVAEVDL